MNDNGDGRMGGLGSPGERQTGRIDIESQVVLVGAQGGARWLADVVAFLAALLLAFALGGLGAWAFGSAILWMNAANIEAWLLRHSKNAWLNTLFTWAFSQVGLLVLSALLLVGLKVLLPYEWAYDFTAPRGTTRHWLLIFREVDGLADNRLIRFPLLARVILAALPITYYLTSPLLRRRFGDEIAAPFPARAVDYTQAGLDTRQWGQPEHPAPVADVAVLRVEHVDNLGARGNRITSIVELPYRTEIIAAFAALNGGRIPHLSRRNLREIGIGDDIARSIMTVLEEAGYIEYHGGNRNQASALTEKGADLAASIGSGIE